MVEYQEKGLNRIVLHKCNHANVSIVKSSFLIHIAKVRDFYVLETLKSKLAHWFVWITERSTMISYTNYVFRYHSQCSLKLWFYLRWLHNLLFALIIFLQGFKIL